MSDESYKQIERQSVSRFDTSKELDKSKPKPKEGKSTFDELLDQNRRLSEGSIDKKTTSQTVTQQAISADEKLKERFKERGKDHEKEEEKRQETKESKREEALSQKRVVGKANLKHQEGGSQGGGGDGRGGLSREKSSNTQTKKLGETKGEAIVGSHAFAKAFQEKLKMQTGEVPRQVPQDLLNQIIHFVRIGKDLTGEKVVELKCHQEVFQGLTLRFGSKGGKVKIHFMTKNPSIKELFEKESEAIRETLTSKGISVEEIRIT